MRRGRGNGRSEKAVMAHQLMSRHVPRTVLDGTAGGRLRETLSQKSRPWVCTSGTYCTCNLLALLKSCATVEMSEIPHLALPLWTFMYRERHFRGTILNHRLWFGEVKYGKTQPIPRPQHKPATGSPFCSDPNCPYCMELRRKFDEMRKHNVCRPSRSAE
jgi:hypothetical protein